MEATPAPRLFNSGEMCWKMIRVSIVEYLSRDTFYGAMFGVQVIRILLLYSSSINDEIIYL